MNTTLEIQNALISILDPAVKLQDEGMSYFLGSSYPFRDFFDLLS